MLENKCHSMSLKELSFWSSVQRVEKHIIEWLLVDKAFASKRISDKCSEFIIIKIQISKYSYSSQWRGWKIKSGYQGKHCALLSWSWSPSSKIEQLLEEIILSMCVSTSQLRPVGDLEICTWNLWNFQGLDVLITLEGFHDYTAIIRSHTSELQPLKQRDSDSTSTWIPNWTLEFLQEAVAAIQHFMGLAGTCRELWLACLA